MQLFPFFIGVYVGAFAWAILCNIFPSEDRPSLQELWELMSDWQQKQFGSDQTRGPIGTLKHLRKEVDEAIKNPNDLEEYVDIYFMTVDSCRRAGYTFDQFRRGVDEKLQKNMARRWSKPVDGEPCEHIREDGHGDNS